MCVRVVLCVCVCVRAWGYVCVSEGGIGSAVGNAPTLFNGLPTHKGKIIKTKNGSGSGSGSGLGSGLGSGGLGLGLGEC